MTASSPEDNDSPPRPWQGSPSFDLDGTPLIKIEIYPYQPREVNSLEGAEYELNSLSSALQTQPDYAVTVAPVALEQVSDYVSFTLSNATKLLSEEATVILTKAQVHLTNATDALTGSDTLAAVAEVEGAAASVSAALAVQEPEPEPSPPDPLTVNDYVSMAGAAGGLLAAGGTVITATTKFTNTRRKSRATRETETPPSEKASVPPPSSPIEQPKNPDESRAKGTRSP